MAIITTILQCDMYCVHMYVCIDSYIDSVFCTDVQLKSIEKLIQ